MIELHSINAFNMNKMSGLFSYHSPHCWSDTCVCTTSFAPNCMELYHSSIHINNVLNPNVWNSIAPYSSIHRTQIQLNPERIPIKMPCALRKLYTSYYYVFYLFSKHCSLNHNLTQFSISTSDQTYCELTLPLTILPPINFHLQT